jgi:hypothetical protein
MRRVSDFAGSFVGRQVYSRLKRRLKAGRLNIEQADVAQLAEHILGKDEVTSSILVVGSSDLSAGSAPFG